MIIMSNLSNNKRIAKNSVFMSIRMVIVLGISLFTTRIVLRVLGVEDYGIFNVVAGFVSMFGFLNTSMSNGIQRYFNFELAKNGITGANHVYCTAVLIQSLVALVIIALTESFGLWFLHYKMVIPADRMFAAEWIFQFAILSFLFTIMQAPYTAAVMAHERMDFYAVISVLDATVKLGVVFLIPLLSKDNLILYGLFILLISVLNFLIYFLYCKMHFPEIKLHRFFDKKQFLSMLGFSGWNIFGSFSNMMRNQGINIIMNLFFGPIVNAARGIATQINSGITNFVSSILVPTRPQVIQSYARNEMDRVMNLTYSISKLCLCILMLLAVPICVEIDFVLDLWLGEAIPEHSQTFCIIVLITSSILIPMNAQSTLVHASGKMKNYQVIGSTVKFMAVPAAYIMMKLGYAPEWALLMVLLFDLIGLLVGMYIIETIMPFSVLTYSKKVFLPLLPVVTLSILILLLVKNYFDFGILRFITICVISTIVISSLFYVFSLSKTEKNIIIDILNKHLKRK